VILYASWARVLESSPREANLVDQSAATPWYNGNRGKNVPAIINLIIIVMLFSIAAYGLYWICIKFELPKPVLWICGALLIIVILLFLSGGIHLPMLLPGGSQ
jgi:hypothetical protein